MTDANRILTVLLHDLRTPLGIAQGYLRLVRDQRLTAPEDQARALAGALDALATMARLCGDAGALTAEAPRWPPVRVPALTLTGAVTERARGRGVPVDVVPGDARRAVTLAYALDQTADALVAALLAPVKDASMMALRVELTDEELRLAADHADAIDTHLSAPPCPYDPWHRPGLALALACRLITDGGGRLWRVADAPAFTGIALPLESAPR